jgi:hypothetical protein
VFGLRSREARTGSRWKVAVERTRPSSFAGKVLARPSKALQPTAYGARRCGTGAHAAAELGRWAGERLTPASGEPSRLKEAHHASYTPDPRCSELLSVAGWATRQCQDRRVVVDIGDPASFKAFLREITVGGKVMAIDVSTGLLTFTDVFHPGEEGINRVPWKLHFDNQRRFWRRGQRVTADNPPLAIGDFIYVARHGSDRASMVFDTES